MSTFGRKARINGGVRYVYNGLFLSSLREILRMKNHCSCRKTPLPAVRTSAFPADPMVKK